MDEILQMLEQRKGGQKFRIFSDVLFESSLLVLAPMTCVLRNTGTALPHEIATNLIKRGFTVTFLWMNSVH